MAKDKDIKVKEEDRKLTPVEIAMAEAEAENMGVDLTDDEQELADLVNETEVATAIPTGYIPVELASMGCFNMPKVLHVKNFHLEDILALSMEQEKDSSQALINLMGSLIYEDVDCKDMTQQEAVDILLNIFNNFWESTLRDIPYPVQEDELAECKVDSPEIYENLTKHKWKPKINIPIDTITIRELEGGSKNKIQLKLSDGKKVVFRTTLIGDSLKVKKLVGDKFDTEESKIKPLLKNYKKYAEAKERDASTECNLTDEAVVTAESFLTRKFLYTVKLTKIILILELDGVKLDSTEARLKASLDPRIDSKVMKQYDFALQSLDYGVMNNVMVKSPLTGKTVERRFQFQLDTIIHAVQVYKPNEDDFKFI